MRTACQRAGRHGTIELPQAVARRIEPARGRALQPPPARTQSLGERGRTELPSQEPLAPARAALQPPPLRFLKAGRVDEAVDVDDVDELHRRLHLRVRGHLRRTTASELLGAMLVMKQSSASVGVGAAVRGSSRGAAVERHARSGRLVAPRTKAPIAHTTSRRAPPVPFPFRVAFSHLVHPLGASCRATLVTLAGWNSFIVQYLVGRRAFGISRDAGTRPRSRLAHGRRNRDRAGG